MKLKCYIFNNGKLYTSIFILFFSFLQLSCRKLAETPVPTDKIAENAVYSSDATAISALTAIYSAMNTGPIQGSQSNTGSVTLFAGLSADEFTLNSNFLTYGSYLNYYQNNLSMSSPPGTGGDHWAPMYNFVFKCNAAVQGLISSNADGLTPVVKQQLLGEAKFLRAFFYFYLVNEFGDVPLTLTTDPQITSSLAKSPKADVYNQIIADLKDAEQNLSSNFLDATLLKITSERVRPTKWAASALLSRAYLYTNDNSDADAEASSVINNTSMFTLLPLNQVFLKNSKEAIWQIQPTDVNLNTRDGQAFIISSSGPTNSGDVHNPVRLSKNLLSSFEAGDQRAKIGNWIDTTIYPLTTTTSDTVPYPYKYKVSAAVGVNTPGGMSEYFMVLRLAELYLIRAEARAKLGNTGGAQSDLNMIRNRAGLGNTAANDGPSLLAAILHERQTELFAEWGHRWFDLKRTGSVDAVMSSVTPLKAAGASWRSFQQLYPVPILDIQKSTNLTQNSGY